MLYGKYYDTLFTIKIKTNRFGSFYTMTNKKDKTKTEVFNETTKSPMSEKIADKIVIVDSIFDVLNNAHLYNDGSSTSLKKESCWYVIEDSKETVNSIEAPKCSKKQINSGKPKLIW